MQVKGILMSYEIQASDSDGYIYSSKLTYAEARDASSGTVVGGASSFKVGQHFKDASFTINQAFGGLSTLDGRIGQKVTFGPGTIFSVSFCLRRWFSGTGTATARIRKYSDKSIIATIGTVDVSTLSGSYEWIEFVCSPEVEISESTEILLLIEYHDGTEPYHGLIVGTNTDVGGGFLVYWYPDTWVENEDADCAVHWHYRKFEIYRGFVFFDTSDVAGRILDATLRLYTPGWAGSEETEEFTIVIQSGMPTYPTDPLAAADYNRTKYSGDLGSYSITVAGWDAEAEYIDIPLNADGIAAINKGGVTKFCLRSDKDIDGTGTYSEGDFPDQYIFIWSKEYSGGEKAATLLISTPRLFAWII